MAKRSAKKTTKRSRKRQPSQRQARTKAGKAMALAAARENAGIIRYCAQAAGVSRVTLWQWLQKDAQFAEDFEGARKDGVEKLEQEAIRRAHDGWDEPVYQDGVCIGHKRKYSDRLLELLLRSHKPDVYREPSAGLRIDGGSTARIIVELPAKETEEPPDT